MMEFKLVIYEVEECFKVAVIKEIDLHWYLYLIEV